MLPPDMGIAIRVLGQCQKHGASLADDIAKWGFARFFLFFGSRSAHLAAPSDHHYEHTLCGHIQGHVLYLCIMGDATVPWFGPIPPIGHQGH